MESVRATRRPLEEFELPIHNRDIERWFPVAEPPRGTIGRIGKPRQLRPDCSPRLPMKAVPSQAEAAE